MAMACFTGLKSHTSKLKAIEPRNMFPDTFYYAGFSGFTLKNAIATEVSFVMNRRILKRNSKFGPIDLFLAILRKSLDRAIFLYIFIREARLNGVRASIAIVHIRK